MNEINVPCYGHCGDFTPYHKGGWLSHSYTIQMPPFHIWIPTHPSNILISRSLVRTPVLMLTPGGWYVSTLQIFEIDVSTPISHKNQRLFFTVIRHGKIFRTPIPIIVKWSEINRNNQDDSYKNYIFVAWEARTCWKLIKRYRTTHRYNCFVNHIMYNHVKIRIFTFW